MGLGRRPPRAHPGGRAHGGHRRAGHHQGRRLPARPPEPGQGNGQLRILIPHARRPAGRKEPRPQRPHQGDYYGPERVPKNRHLPAPPPVCRQLRRRRLQRRPRMGLGHQLPRAQLHSRAHGGNRRAGHGHRRCLPRRPQERRVRNGELRLLLPAAPHTKGRQGPHALHARQKRGLHILERPENRQLRFFGKQNGYS